MVIDINRNGLNESVFWVNSRKRLCIRKLRGGTCSSFSAEVRTFGVTGLSGRSYAICGS